MSNLSELLPTGGGQNAVDFVATGTLASGVTVVLKTDGTVEAVAGVAGGGGTPTVFGASIALSSVPSIVYDTLNDKVVISYAENTSCYSVVGTVSGTSISFGTPVSFGANAFDGANAGISSAFDSNSNKVVVTFKDSSNSNYVTIRVGTVSGTSISFGSALHEYIPIDDDTATVFDSTNNKIVVFFRNTFNNTGGCQVGTVSGTSISLGAQQTFVAATAYPQSMSALFDSDSGKTVTVYRAVGSNNNYGTAFVGTVSGTGISFGTSVVYESSDSTYNTLAYDSTTGKVVIGFRANTYGNAIVGTVSGTSISFGTKNVWHSADTNEISLAYDIPKSKIVLSYRDSSNGYYISSIDGTVSGTSISFGPAFDISGSRGNKTFSVYDPDSAKVVVGYGNQDNSYIGTAVVVTTPNSNYTSFIGITAEAISSAATGPVNVYGGINAVQTGLTIASDYYVQVDGSLSTTTSTVKAGQAVSATTINMKDLT
jgi:hypothetical protein